MATIRQRRRGVWEVRSFIGYDNAGNPKQVSRTVHGSKRDAQREAARLEVKATGHGGGRRVSDLLDEWIEVKSHGWAPHTVQAYTNRSSKIKEDQIANQTVASLGVADIDRWAARCRRQGVGESAIRNRHSTLRTALQQAVRWEWIATNPASNAPVRQANRIQRSAMTDEDVRAVLDAASEVDEFAYLALRLAAETGARRAELAALRWESLVDDRLVIDRQVTVAADISGVRRKTVGATKTGNRRAVTLSAPTLEVVRVMAEAWAPLTVWMFSPDDDAPNPDRIGWWWRRVRKAAGIDEKWRLHDLRHWSATNAIAGGADVRTVANRLGHSDPSMTLRVYSHAVRAADVELAAKLGAVLED